MSLAQLILRTIDLFYVRPMSAILPLQTFRYAACGVVNIMLLDPLWYALFYNVVFGRVNFDLGIVVISPHVAALMLVFPITFFTGFWLNRYVAFRNSPLSTCTQLGRYAFSVVGSLLLNYGCVKLFVEVCGIWPTPSKILTNIISTVYSFVIAKYFTFRHALEE